MWNSALFKVYIVMIQAMKLTRLLIHKMIIKTTWHPAMLVAAHTLYEITMNQYVIDADQTWSHTPAKCSRKRPLTGNRNQSHYKIITALEVNLMVIVTQMFNNQVPPVNWSTLPNHWKPQRK